MICVYETVIRVLQVRLKSNDGLLSNVFDLLHEVTNVLAFAHQVFDYRRKQLFRAFVVVLELLAWRFKPL